MSASQGPNSSVYNGGQWAQQHSSTAGQHAAGQTLKSKANAGHFAQQSALTFTGEFHAAKRLANLAITGTFTQQSALLASNGDTSYLHNAVGVALPQ